MGGEKKAQEVIDATDASVQAFYDNVEVLVKHDLVEGKEMTGNAWIYRAKFCTDVVRTFQQFRRALVE